MNSAGKHRVGLISNPRSGHNRDQFAALAEHIGRSQNILHLTTESADQIPNALTELRAADIDTLAINGGDGTASSVLGCLLEEALFPELPAIVILPGGTANMNAGDVGARGPLRNAIKRFCRWCEDPDSATAQRLQRPLLRVSTADTPVPRYGMFLGAGAVIQGTEYAHREIHARGLRDDFSLALGTARTIWGVLRNDPQFKRHQRIEVALNDGDWREYDTLILAISTLQRLAFGMRPFWGKEPGELRLTLMEQGCSHFARTFYSIARGKPNRNAVPSQGYLSQNASQIGLSLEGKLNLDGEIIEAAGPVQVETSPTVEFLRL